MARPPSTTIDTHGRLQNHASKVDSDPFSCTVKTVMPLKRDRFSDFCLPSPLLTLWVTHSSVKLNVKHIFLLENKNIHAFENFYLDQNSLQFMQDYFKSKLILNQRSVPFGRHELQRHHRYVGDLEKFEHEYVRRHHLLEVYRNS